MPKYEFINETQDFRGLTVRRIRRVSDQKIGGFLGSEFNLSQAGSCFVHGDSIVAEKATVTNDAQIHGLMHGAATAAGRAKVYGEMWENAAIDDDARLYGRASGNCRISGAAVVYGEVSGNSEINN